MEPTRDLSSNPVTFPDVWPTTLNNSGFRPQELPPSRLSLKFYAGPPNQVAQLGCCFLWRRRVS